MVKNIFQEIDVKKVLEIHKKKKKIFLTLLNTSMKEYLIINL